MLLFWRDDAVDVLTVKEVADRLKCGVTTVYEMVASGDLKGFRLGAGKGGVRVLASSVEQLVTGPQEEVGEPSPAHRLRRKKRAPITPVSFTHLSR